MVFHAAQSMLGSPLAWVVAGIVATALLATVFVRLGRGLVATAFGLVCLDVVIDGLGALRWATYGIMLLHYEPRAVGFALGSFLVAAAFAAWRWRSRGR